MESGRFVLALLLLCSFLALFLHSAEAAEQPVQVGPMQMKRFYSWEEGKRSADSFPGDFDSMPLDRMFKRRFYAWARHFQKRQVPTDAAQL
uniref:Uncharacterized protein n=1 Tax=Steinernema glaseri TaxID=37863 RepID=A0A1I7ZZF0_9BILA